MDKRKHCLVLSTLDERGRGHGWSQHIELRKFGFTTDFVCLIRNYADTEHYIIDGLNTGSWHFRKYKFIRFIGKIIFPLWKSMRGIYKGYDFGSTKAILSHLSRTPDYIVIGTYQLFLSPKTIYDLWKETGAKVVLLMTDAKLLGGGCSYPMGCKGYETGCKKCRNYPYAKFIPHRIWKQKEKWFQQVPFLLVGSPSDLKRAQTVPFLKNKLSYPAVTVPEIPFCKTKKEARKQFGIGDDDFVIFAGAVNIKNKVKGFKEFTDSLSKFVATAGRNRKRRITLLLLGKNTKSIKFDDCVNFVTPGFLGLDELFTAYYACDVYVSPSIDDSGPMMVNYAAACGRPVVSFQVGIAQTLYEHANTGWLAPLFDTDSMARGLSYFYETSPSVLSTIGKAIYKNLQGYKNQNWITMLIENDF